MKYRYRLVSQDPTLNDASQWDDSGLTAGTMAIASNTMTLTTMTGSVVNASPIAAVVGAEYDFTITCGAFSANGGASTITYGGVELWDETDADGTVTGTFTATATGALEIENLTTAETFTFTELTIRRKMRQIGGGKGMFK